MPRPAAPRRAVRGRIQRRRAMQSMAANPPEPRGRSDVGVATAGTLEGFQAFLGPSDSQEV